MSGDNNNKQKKNEALKELRKKRKQQITAVMKKVKINNLNITAIKKYLKEKSDIIPKIAKSLNLPTDQTLWYVMALKKYGEVIEGEKESGFFKYSLIKTDNNAEKAEG